MEVPGLGLRPPGNASRRGRGLAACSESNRPRASKATWAACKSPSAELGAGFEWRPGNVDIHDIKFVEPNFDREATMKEMFNHARKEDGPDVDNS